MKLPDWVDQTTLVLLVIGFPLTLLLAWAQDSQASVSVIDEPNSKAGPTDKTIGEPSIVVLPFRARQSDEIEQLTAEGLTDDITSLLTGVKGIKVAPRLAVGRVLLPDADPLQIASDLGGRFAMTGSVRRNNNQLRISCELTDIRDKEQKWSQNFDRPADDIFAIQDEIAKGVVGAVGTVISRVESARALRQPPANLQAWELTRRALSIVWDWRPQTLGQGLLDARRAIKLDPNYALAHAVLAMILSWRAVSAWTENIAQERDEALIEADIAARLGFDNAEALWPTINAYWASAPQRAVQLYEQSTERHPDIFLSSPFGLAHAGVAYAKMGRVEEGLALIQKFQDTFPNDEYGGVWARVFMGYIELCRRNYKTVADLLANTASEYDGMCRVVALMNSDQQDEAVAEFGRWKAVNPAINLDHYIEQFKVYHIDKSIGAELSDGLMRLKSAITN
ncbi:MAG: hypothetical protein COA84_07325 [Robiginitomaculum sp.]|nr:MAG: hypothetical protein COA84_07325 [Robiginitomaculum sp.]